MQKCMEQPQSRVYLQYPGYARSEVTDWDTFILAYPPVKSTPSQRLARFEGSVPLLTAMYMASASDIFEALISEPFRIVGSKSGSRHRYLALPTENWAQVLRAERHTFLLLKKKSARDSPAPVRALTRSADLKVQQASDSCGVYK